jgi:hypothetical protein
VLWVAKTARSGKKWQRDGKVGGKNGNIDLDGGGPHAAKPTATIG